MLSICCTYALVSRIVENLHDGSTHDGVPSANTDKDQTLASMQRIADVVAKEKAQLWINHDKAQRDSLKMAPDFYD